MQGKSATRVNGQLGKLLIFLPPTSGYATDETNLKLFYSYLHLKIDFKERRKQLSFRSVCGEIKMLINFTTSFGRSFKRAQIMLRAAVAIATGHTLGREREKAMSR